MQQKKKKEKKKKKRRMKFGYGLTFENASRTTDTSTDTTDCPSTYNRLSQM